MLPVHFSLLHFNDMLQCLVACQLPVKNADTPIFACKACACAGDNNVNHKGRSRGSSGNVAIGGNGGNGGNNNRNNANGGSGNSGDNSGNGGIARGNNGNGGNGGNAIGGEPSLKLLAIVHFSESNKAPVVAAFAQHIALLLFKSLVGMVCKQVGQNLRAYHTALLA